MKNVQLYVPTHLKYMDSSLSFLSETLNAVAGDGAFQKEEIQAQCRSLFEAILKKHEKNLSSGEIHIEIKNTEEAIQVEFQNQGVPIFSEDLPPGFVFQNRGRFGQTVVIHPQIRNLPAASDSKVIYGQFPIKSLVNAPDSSPVHAIQIRRLDPSEAPSLSRLFHRVYRYRYINEYVYFPEKLKAMMESGQLISLVAETDDKQLVGHIGLICRNEAPVVIEAALGVVDSEFKGNRLFGQIFQRAVNEMNGRDLAYCVYDFVTNHDFSQKMVAKHGFCDLALFLGNQVAETQARLHTLGLGADPEKMDRYSLLVAVGPKVRQPFGKSIVLPTNIGEACEFLLGPLHLQWIPAPRFYPLPPAGEFAVQVQTEQKAVIFDFIKPGRQALRKIIESWQQHLREGYQYFAVDVPLDFPGVGQIYDILSKHGFFMAGFIPYHFSNRLGFRFQFLLPTQVNFNAIKLLSENGKKLLNMVRKNHERNSVL